MRFLMCAFLSLATASLAVAGDVPSDPNKPSLSLLAVESSLDPAIAREFFFTGYSPATNLIDIPDFRDRPWFRPLVVAYWVGVAVRSYRGDGRFRLKRLIGQESATGASFEADDGWRRAIFIPRRSMPLVAFPLKKGASVDSLLAVSVTSHGAALTYACTLGPPRPRRH